MCINKPNQDVQIEMNFEEQPELSVKSVLRLSRTSSFVILAECFLFLYLKNIVLSFWHPYKSVKSEKLLDAVSLIWIWTSRSEIRNLIYISYIGKLHIRIIPIFFRK